MVKGAVMALPQNEVKHKVKHGPRDQKKRPKFKLEERETAGSSSVIFAANWRTVYVWKSEAIGSWDGMKEGPGRSHHTIQQNF